jgi:flagellin
MGLDINTNLASLQAADNLSNSQNMLATSMNRLSSGYRINSAADDASGLAISTSMDMQVQSYTVAARNANDAISMAQTADGALGSVSDILGTMQTLATEGANGAISTSDRSYLQTEFSQLQAEISNILTSSKYNGIQVVQSAAKTVDFQTGITSAATDRIAVTFGGVSLATLVGNTITLSSTATNSQKAMGAIANALNTISTSRAKFGAAINRFDVVVSNLQTASLNTSAAESRIKDVDVAAETANLSREQVLIQAGASVLAQANQVPQVALKLLQ